MKWVGEQTNYEFTIEQNSDGNFDLCVSFLGDKRWLWFRSYSAARNFIKNEFGFEGRLKKVD